MPLYRFERTCGSCVYDIEIQAVCGGAVEEEGDPYTCDDCAPPGVTVACDT